MGQRPYPVTWPNLRASAGLRPGRHRAHRAVAFSRAEVCATRRTTGRDRVAGERVPRQHRQGIQTLVRQAPTARERRAAVARRWHDKRRDTSSPLTWGGRPMPDTFKAPDGTRFTITERSTGWGMSRLPGRRVQRRLRAQRAVRHGLRRGQLRSAKKKLNAYVEQQGLDVRHYVLSPAGLPGAADLFDPAKVVRGRRSRRSLERASRASARAITRARRAPTRPSSTAPARTSWRRRDIDTRSRSSG